MRSEALKIAQKKYLNKIKEQDNEVYQRIRNKQKIYQKEYNKNKVFTNEEKEKYKQYSKIFYENNKENILEKRKEKREKKKDIEIKDLINLKIGEIIIDI